MDEKLLDGVLWLSAISETSNWRRRRCAMLFLHREGSKRKEMVFSSEPKKKRKNYSSHTPPASAEESRNRRVGACRGELSF